MLLAETSAAAARPLDLVTAVFVSILVGLAFAEMLACLRDAIRKHGIRIDDMLVFLTFFLTGVRFFIGNQLYLSSMSLEKGQEVLWFYDFIVLTLISVMLVMMGSVSSVEGNESSKIGIYPMLIGLYVSDVLWIGSHKFLSVAGLSSRSAPPPLEWAVLNIALILSVLVIAVLARRNLYSRRALAALGFVNGAAFIVDLYLVIKNGIVG